MRNGGGEAASGVVGEEPMEEQPELVAVDEAELQGPLQREEDASKSAELVAKAKAANLSVTSWHMLASLYTEVDDEVSSSSDTATTRQQAAAEEEEEIPALPSK
jgi:hypothetical protein